MSEETEVSCDHQTEEYEENAKICIRCGTIFDVWVPACQIAHPPPETT